MIPWLEMNNPFPDVSEALTEQDDGTGLLATGANLSSRRLLKSYRSGIFPWFSENQPILWWSADPRMVAADRSVRHLDQPAQRPCAKYNAAWPAIAAGQYISILCLSR